MIYRNGLGQPGAFDPSVMSVPLMPASEPRILGLTLPMFMLLAGGVGGVILMLAYKGLTS